MKATRVLLRAVFRAVLISFVAGAAACGGRVDLSQYPDPLSLYDASLKAYRQGDCDFAEAGFRRLTLELAQREPLQADAQYYIAECSMLRGNFLEAARQFRRVSDGYPRHRLAPDALLRAGDAYAELWKRPELDPSYGEAALATYRELIGRYPTRPAAERSRLRIAELNDLFAEKEFRTGVFYLRIRAYDSAIISFKDVIARYPQSKFAGDAVLRLVEAYGRIGYDEEKREMCLHLRQYYPNVEGGAKLCPERAESR